MQEKARFIGTTELAWRHDTASGARFWSVALERTQLTCFEVPPHARFERHSHASEQITLVLDGMLIFVLDGETHEVGAGEVIAVPGELPHAVLAGPQGARAVDSWSPPVAAYSGADA